jgi:hypothetical protein
VSHANAALTPRARLKLARLVVDQQWPVARAAEHYDVSWPTAKRWADHYRELGRDRMADRSSRPHRAPRRTPQPLVRKIVHLRWKHRLEPVRTRLAPSTVHQVLVRCRVNRLSRIDRVTGEPVRRCAATSTSAPARWSTPTSRNSATCPEAAAGATSAAPRACGKVERFHRTLADRWAFRKFYSSDSARRASYPPGSTTELPPAPTPHSGTQRPSPGSSTSLNSTTNPAAGSCRLPAKVLESPNVLQVRFLHPPLGKPRRPGGAASHQRGQPTSAHGSGAGGRSART